MYVLGCGPAYAQAVAEHRPGPRPRRRARHQPARTAPSASAPSGTSPTATTTPVLLRGSNVGLLGYGNLGRALHRLLAAVRRRTSGCTTRGCPTPVLLQSRASLPASLDETLPREPVPVRAGDGHGREPAPARCPRARPAPARGPPRPGQPGRGRRLRRAARPRRATAASSPPSTSGPTSRCPPDSPGPPAGGPGVLRAPRRRHPAGLPRRSATWCVDDLRQIDRGLPPVRMQVAARELVGRYRNRPVT